MERLSQVGIFTFVSLVDDVSHLLNYLFVKLDEIVGANLC